jgi:uncharacterized protein YegP (UPF0339 family)
MGWILDALARCMTPEDDAMARRPRIEVFPHGDGQFGFRLVAANGEIQGGGEGYKTRGNARRGARAAKRNWQAAEIVDVQERRR